MNFSPEAIFAWLEAMTHDPFGLAAALALATLVTEDGALVAGSLLVGSDLASPWLVISALLVGIVGGDVALYFAGWSAREFRAIRQRLPIKRAKKIRNWLRGRETAILFFSRFLPGTRLVTYVTFGFLRLSLAHFVVVMTIACMVWVIGVVFFISEIQRAFSGMGGTVAALVATGAAVTIILIAPRLARRSKSATTLDDAVEESTDASK